MRSPRVSAWLAPGLLAAVFFLLPVCPAAAQDSPPHEGEGLTRPGAATLRKAPAPAAKPHAAPTLKAHAAPAAKAAPKAPATGKKDGPQKTADPKTKGRDKPPLRSLDTNHDGRITHEEFTAGSKKRFSKADTNHDGVVSPKEASDAKAKMVRKQVASDARRVAAGKTPKYRKKTDKPPRPYLSTFDKNKDGRVTQKEYLSRREQKFVEMDTNHDGVISREEARMAKKMALERREERKAEAKERRLRKVAQAKAEREAAGSLSSTGPELTAPVAAPPQTPPVAPSAAPSAPKVKPVPEGKAPQQDLPLTPIAPDVPAKPTPET